VGSSGLETGAKAVFGSVSLFLSKPGEMFLKPQGATSFERGDINVNYVKHLKKR